MFHRAWVTTLFSVAVVLSAYTLTFTGCAARRPPEPTAPPLTSDSVANAVYRIDHPDFPEVRLTNGHYDNRAAYVNATLVDSFRVFTDIDGDGDVDAVVLLVTNYGGSGIFVDLAVVRNDDGRPVHAASYPLGDRTRPVSLTVRGAIITMDLIVHGPGEPRCCPTVEVTQRYRFADGALSLYERPKLRIPDPIVW